MSPETRYRIEELEKLTGLSRRLIYDYISRDLVPAAMGSGKGAYYLQEHYDRLRLISLLRTMGFRLERIEEALASWSQAEISRIVEFAEGRDVESLDALNAWLTRPAPEDEPGVAALMSAAAANSEEAAASEEPPRRYRSDEALQRMRRIADDEMAFEELAIDGVKSSEDPAAEDRTLNQADEAPAEKPRSAMPVARSAAPEYAASKRVLPRASRLMANLSRARSSGTKSPEPEAPQTWHRVPITRDVEISYRAEGGADMLRRVRELIARAMEIFKE